MPSTGQRIASVNSFGYGGSNAHVVLQDAESFLAHRSYKAHTTSFAPRSFDDFFDDDEVTETALARPNVLVFSANDEPSLIAAYDALRRHLINPSVNLKLPDLAYTLSNHRSRHFYRGYLVRNQIELPEGSLTIGKKNSEAPKIGLVFTGQGAQWSQMGKGLIDHFSSARSLLKSLDTALQGLPDAPSWSIIGNFFNCVVFLLIDTIQMSSMNSAAQIISDVPSSLSLWSRLCNWSSCLYSRSGV